MIFVFTYDSILLMFLLYIRCVKIRLHTFVSTYYIIFGGLLMNLILFNGQVFTMDDTKTIHSAICIQNKKILAVGTDERVLQEKNKDTLLIDLKGRLVFPGFHDSHMHLLGYGMALCQVDLSPARSIEEMVTLTQEFIKENNIPEGSWILGRGWNQDLFKEKKIPNQYDLDLISQKHPILLRRVCGHVAVTNTYVLKKLKLASDYNVVPGGFYQEGIFRENAMDLVVNQIPDPSIDEIKHYIKTGIKALHSFGITSVQSDDLCVFQRDMTQRVMDIFESMALDGDLNIHVYEQSLFRDLKGLKHFIDKGYCFNHKINTFKYGPLKILGDGALGGRTAWLRNPYADQEDTYGVQMYTQEALNDMVGLAQEKGIPSAIHCIGDAMLDSALEAISNAQKKYPHHDLRHGIVHCQITHKDQLEFMKKHQIFAFVQPIFLDYDLNILEARVGKALAETSYAWHTMKEMDIPLAFGSDAPVETPDPIKGMFCSVNRQTLSHWPQGGFVPTEKLDPYESLKNYTVTPAYTAYEEDSKGKLIPGYEGDLVVINTTNFDDLLESKVDLTVFQGQVVYKRKA